MIDGGDLHADSALGRIDEVAVVGGDPCIAGTVPQGGSIAIRGWLLDRASGGSVHALTACVGDGSSVDALLNFRRKDVAGAFPWATSAYSGFYAVVPLDVHAGTHPIRLTASFDGTSTRLETRCSVEVARTMDPLAGCVERGDGWAYSIDGLYSFDEPVDGYRPGAVCSVPVDRPASLKIWAVDLRSRKPATSVVARLGGTYLAVTHGIERPDVAANLGIPDAVRCGFAVPIVAPLAGTASLDIFALSPEGSYFRLPTVRVQQPVPLPDDAIPDGARVEGAIDEVTVDGHTAPFGKTIVVRRGQAIVLRGWCIDHFGPRVPGGIEAKLGDASAIAGVRGVPRPDIAANFGHSALLDSEFRLTIDTGTEEIGEHRLVVRALSASRDRRAIIAQTTVHIQPESPDREA